MPCPQAAEAHHKDIAARRRAAEHRAFRHVQLLPPKCSCAHLVVWAELNALQASPTDDDLAARIAELQAAVGS